MQAKDLLPFLDLTSLGALDRACDAISLAERARVSGCAAVCVYPRFIPSLISHGGFSGLKLATVCSFPHGQSTPELKGSEAKMLCELGADEIDMVVSIGAIREKNWDLLFKEVSSVKMECGKRVLKVILETSLFEGLDEGLELLSKASQVSCEAGCDFLKTSTGKEVGGATVQSVTILCKEAKKYFHETKRRVGIKPSGGIKTVASAKEFAGIVRNSLGPDWLTPSLFRLGASSLLDAILAEEM